METPDFELYLPVSRLESDISRIIAKVAISSRLPGVSIKIEVASRFEKCNRLYQKEAFTPLLLEGIGACTNALKCDFQLSGH